MHRSVAAIACALAGCGFMTAARAVQVPELFAVTVQTSDPQQATQEALRTVLVRLTGARGAGDDPALAGIVNDARRYAQVVRSTAGGGTQVLFDGSAVRAAVTATGHPVWDLDRPLLRVELPAAGISDELRSRITAEAQARGVPISLAERAEGAGTDNASELATAHRSGASATLVGESMPDPGQWHWQLAAVNAAGDWAGAAEAGIDGAVDALVRADLDNDAIPMSDVDCHVSGVADLSAYVNVLNLIGGTPGVSALAVQEIDGDNLLLRLRMRGGGAALARALSGEMLVAADSGGTDYRYQPSR
jgi:hypothetical protein